MTTDEIEDVVRALTTAVENLEAGAARQSMQRHSFKWVPMPMQRGHPPGRGRRSNDRPEPKILRRECRNCGHRKIIRLLAVPKRRPSMRSTLLEEAGWHRANFDGERQIRSGEDDRRYEQGGEASKPALLKGQGH